MNGNLKTIHGIIIPATWDKEGDIVAVAIATKDEQEYLVEDDDVGRNLLSHIRQEVVLKGSLKKKQKKPTMKVETFRVKDIKI